MKKTFFQPFLYPSLRLSQPSSSGTREVDEKYSCNSIFLAFSALSRVVTLEIAATEVFRCWGKYFYSRKVRVHWVQIEDE